MFLAKNSVSQWVKYLAEVINGDCIYCRVNTTGVKEEKSTLMIQDVSQTCRCVSDLASRCFMYKLKKCEERSNERSSFRPFGFGQEGPA